MRRQGGKAVNQLFLGKFSTEILADFGIKKASNFLEAINRTAFF